MTGGMYDPSVLFDLDDILMAGDCNDMNPSSLIHSPIKEEPEYEPDDNRYIDTIFIYSIIEGILRTCCIGWSSDLLASHGLITYSEIVDSFCRYVHSPVGLPIPNRNGAMLGFPTIKQEPGGGGNGSNSPAGGMWGCPVNVPQMKGANVPFPVTPFNTPAQGPSAFVGIDLKSFLLSGNSGNNHVHYGNNPTLTVSIKEEPDETMKVKQMILAVARQPLNL